MKYVLFYESSDDVRAKPPVHFPAQGRGGRYPVVSVPFWTGHLWPSSFLVHLQVIGEVLLCGSHPASERRVGSGVKAYDERDYSGEEHSHGRP